MTDDNLFLLSKFSFMEPNVLRYTVYCFTWSKENNIFWEAYLFFLFFFFWEWEAYLHLPFVYDQQAVKFLMAFFTKTLAADYSGRCNLLCWYICIDPTDPVRFKG